MDVLCEVAVASQDEVNSVESTMISDNFSNALVTDIQNIDSSLASVSVEVTSYDPTSKKTFFFHNFVFEF